MWYNSYNALPTPRVPFRRVRCMRRVVLELIIEINVSNLLRIELKRRCTPCRRLQRVLARVVHVVNAASLGRPFSSSNSATFSTAARCCTQWYSLLP